MIVVIAILATITVVSYLGITDNAIEATLKTELSNMSKQLELYKVEHNDVYPSSSQFIKECTSTQASDSSNFCYKFNDDYVFDYRISTSLDDYTLIITNSGKHKAAFKTKDGSPTMASGKNLIDISQIIQTSSLLYDPGTGALMLLPKNNSNGYNKTSRTLSQLCPTLKVNDTVTLSAIRAQDPGVTSLNEIYISKSNTDWYFGTSQTITQDMLDGYVLVYGAQLELASAISGSVYLKLQLELGTTATSWEPYIPMFHE